MKTHRTQKYAARFLALGLCAMLSACSAVDRLSNIGEPPQMTKISNPVTQPDYQPVSLPMPTPQNIVKQKNSLWASDRVTFFKDQRAKNIGDIITVMVDITDEATLENESERSRSSSEGANLSRLLGLEQDIDMITPEAINDSATGLLNPELSAFDSTSSHNGAGSTEREEEIALEIAALITQILPNGNMVISGRQEVRVNFEKRILQIDGVIRPEDISTQNTIDHNRIAEARIVYGGEGQLTDVQQPRYGQQLYDIIFPF
ncbi:MAG: flagellar basal body L-ring protein [Alphaproteobacteria bacterium]|nr:flagellar basal body L-ring protein [Alphaproteobacteria bacterium]HCQ71236.1 flagellar basal body L-ring protein [Rhodospirillaceae bacterium]|tara:strand:+ start:7779 stop:8561 length:783 start_codon:yes stop_codon:yes gene_type:complete